MPLKISEDITLTSLISDHTAFGVVYNTSDPKLVVKLQIVKNSQEIEDEIEVGFKVNPKYATKFVNAFKVYPKSSLHEKILTFVPRFNQEKKSLAKYSISVIVIENIVQSSSHTSLSLNKYFKELEKKKFCPSKHHRIYRFLKKSLIEFYKIGYYHGDLHMNNIFVVVQKNNPFYVVTVKIIDFGMSLPFKIPKPTNCLKSILNEISSTFKKNKQIQKRIWLKNNKVRTERITQFFNSPFKYILNANNITASNSQKPSASSQKPSASSQKPSASIKCWTTSKGRTKPYVVCVDKKKFKK